MMVLAAGVGRAWYYSFDWRKGLAKGRFRRNGRKTKSGVGAGEAGTRKEEKNLGHPGGMAKGQQANLSCVCAHRGVSRNEKKRKGLSQVDWLVSQPRRVDSLGSFGDGRDWGR